MKRLIPVFLMVILTCMSAFAGDISNIRGEYTRVAGQPFKFNGKTVEVMEFMSFYCSHCYAFEKSIPVIKGNFPNKIKWKLVPIYWGNGSSKPGEAYLLAEEAGKGEQMKKAIFNAMFVDKKDIGSVEVLESLASQAGMGFDFSMKLRSGAKAEEARKAVDLAHQYGVEETPTIIIAGSLMTNPRASGGGTDAFKDNAITIIKSILETTVS
ncbi:MAG: DsbA family protein [Deltaproteobacteria bacterium]|nr:DsbA family protein [Deltaproteobacteria bacterium]